MLKKKKTTASGELVLVKSVRIIPHHLLFLCLSFIIFYSVTINFFSRLC